MSAQGRRIALAEQERPFAQTGIDFIYVDPDDHARVLVYFVIDPADPDLAMSAGDFGIECTGIKSGQDSEVIHQTLAAQIDAQGRSRTALVLTFASGASFETQLLTITDLVAARIDPYSRTTKFSFKQSCPSVFDCGCPDPSEKSISAGYPTDYLARDFESFLESFFTYSSERYPDWQMNLTADQAVMLGEVMAALGDEFSYIQDRYALETQFDHLQECKSFEQITRILGYRLQPEMPAQGYIVCRHFDGQDQTLIAPGATALVTAGTQLQGFGDSDQVIPIEVGHALSDILAEVTYDTNAAWTDVPAHVADETCPKLEKGARSIDVVGRGLSNLPVGSKLLIETRPARQAVGLHRFIVTVMDVQTHRDELLGVDTTRLIWGAEDVPHFDLPLDVTFVSANLVPVMAGETHIARFTIGDTETGLPTAIEREGPLARGQAIRPIIYRFPLARTVSDGLAWRASASTTPWDLEFEPEVALQRETGPGTTEGWTVVRDILTQTGTDEAATVEAGHWGPVFSYLENGLRKQHMDYIGDPGHCLRFGVQDFGITPAPGSIFRLAYRTAFGSRGNLPTNRIVTTAGSGLPAKIISVWNPIALSGGTTPENIALAKFTVPHFHKAKKLRAVRNEDFQELLSARDDIQAATANAWWTGCWATTLIATDPEDTIEPDAEYQAEVQRYIEELRLVGHPAYLTAAALRPLDLRIAICVKPHIPFGDTAGAIRDALAGAFAGDEAAFFHPDNLSFGSRIYRADLEARIAAQRGVCSIEQITYRWRGEQDFRPFTETYLSTAPDQIPVLKHDPTRPDLGQLEVFEREIPVGADA